MARAATASAADARRGAYVFAGGLACLVMSWLLRPYGTQPEPPTGLLRILSGTFAVTPTAPAPPSADTVPAPRPYYRGFVRLSDPAGVVLDASVDGPHLAAIPAFAAPDGSAPGCAPIAMAAWTLSVGRLDRAVVDLPDADAFLAADGTVVDHLPARRALVLGLRAAAGTKPQGRGATTYRPGILDAYAAIGYDASIQDGVDVATIARAELAAGRPVLVAVGGKTYGAHGVLVTGIGHLPDGAPVVRIELGWPNHPPAYLRLVDDAANATVRQPVDWIEYAVPAVPVHLPQSSG